jgi:hypothetical protein
MFSNQIPTIISTLFLLAFTFPVVMVARLAKKGNIKNGFFLVIGFYLIYLTVIAFLSLNGFFDTIMLPPKIFVTFIHGTEICKKANASLSLISLVKIHIFRLIGSTFIILYFYDLLPTVFALFAGIGDLVTAVSSIFVAKAIEHKKKYARKLTYLWNTFGLVDILVTSAMAIIFTKISIDNNVQGVEFLAEFPFCFIPAFAPPTIIFLHLLVFRKLSWTKKA